MSEVYTFRGTILDQTGTWYNTSNAVDSSESSEARIIVPAKNSTYTGTLSISMANILSNINNKYGSKYTASGINIISAKIIVKLYSGSSNNKMQVSVTSNTLYSTIVYSSKAISTTAGTSVEIDITNFVKKYSQSALSYLEALFTFTNTQNSTNYYAYIQDIQTKIEFSGGGSGDLRFGSNPIKTIVLDNEIVSEVYLGDRLIFSNGVTETPDNSGSIDIGSGSTTTGSTINAELVNADWATGSLYTSAGAVYAKYRYKVSDLFSSDSSRLSVTFKSTDSLYNKYLYSSFGNDLYNSNAGYYIDIWSGENNNTYLGAFNLELELNRTVAITEATAMYDISLGELKAALRSAGVTKAPAYITFGFYVINTEFNNTSIIAPANKFTLTLNK